MCTVASTTLMSQTTDSNVMDLPGEGNSLSKQRVIDNKEYSTDDLLNLALQPVKINTSPLPEYDLDKLDYALSEGITRTLSGTLWALWVAGGDNDKAFVVLASSKDDGQTWSKPRVVIDPHLPNTFLGIRSLVANI